MSKLRYKPETVYEVDGFTVYIKQDPLMRRTKVYIFQGGKLYTQSGVIFLDEDQAYPDEPTFSLPIEALWVLRAALNEDEAPGTVMSAVITDTLKREQDRVDKLLNVMIKDSLHDG